MLPNPAESGVEIRVPNRVPASFAEIDVLWITAGLSCDGDTVSITAATQPSLEDIVLGGIPGIPKVNFHNPVLAYQNGEDFLAPFHRAAAGKLSPYILVIEGSIPNEKNKAEGYWASFGTDQTTGQPIPTCDWIDRLAPHAYAVVAAGTCATYGGIHAMAGNPTGCMGLPIISVGRGNRRRIFPSCAFRDARFNRTTSWRRFFTCCTWPRG
jgi:Ni,Fe-hydrogenase I small subunit